MMCILTYARSPKRNEIKVVNCMVFVATVGRVCIGELQVVGLFQCKFTIGGQKGRVAKCESPVLRSQRRGVVEGKNS